MNLSDQVRQDASFNQRFRLLDFVGAGGMGEVHRALQLSLDRHVAVKFMNPVLAIDQESQQRFLREAKLAAGLIHSNVVAVFDYGIAGSIPYLVTELVEGES